MRGGATGRVTDYRFVDTEVRVSDWSSLLHKTVGKFLTPCVPRLYQPHHCFCLSLMIVIIRHLAIT